MERRWTLLLLAGSLAALSVGVAWRRIAIVPGIDFYAAWAAARAVAEERVDDPWSLDGRARMGLDATLHLRRPDAPPRELAAATRVLTINRGALPTAGTPFLFTVLGASSTGDYEADYVFFSLAALVFYVGAVLMLCSLLGYPLERSLFALAFLTGPFSPYLSGEGVGNVNTVQLLLVAASAAALVARRHVPGELLGGALLGLGVAFKPNLLPIVLPFLVSLAMWRRWQSAARVSAGLALGGSLAIAGSSLYFGRVTCWLQWIRVLPDLLRPPFGVAMGNFSLPTVFREVTGFEIAPTLFAGALGAFAIFEWRRRAKNAGSTDPDSSSRGHVEAVATLGLGGALLLWTARLAWLHYFLLAVPLVLLILRPAGGSGTQAPSGGARILVLASLAGFLPFSSLTPDIPALVQALGVNASLLVAVVMTLRTLWLCGVARPTPLAARPEET